VAGSRHAAAMGTSPNGDGGSDSDGGSGQNRVGANLGGTQSGSISTVQISVDMTGGDGYQ